MVWRFGVRENVFVLLHMEPRNDIEERNDEPIRMRKMSNRIYHLASKIYTQEKIPIMHIISDTTVTELDISKPPSWMKDLLLDEDTEDDLTPINNSRFPNEVILLSLGNNKHSIVKGQYALEYKDGTQKIVDLRLLACFTNEEQVQIYEKALGVSGERVTVSLEEAIEIGQAKPGIQGLGTQENALTKEIYLFQQV